MFIFQLFVEVTFCVRQETGGIWVLENVAIIYVHVWAHVCMNTLRYTHVRVLRYTCMCTYVQAHTAQESTPQGDTFSKEAEQ